MQTKWEILQECRASQPTQSLIDKPEFHQESTIKHVNNLPVPSESLLIDVLENSAPDLDSEITGE